MIAALSAFSPLLLICIFPTAGAVFASQAGYATMAGEILRSVPLHDEQTAQWIWAVLASFVSGLALVMPKPDIEAEPDPDRLMAARQAALPMHGWHTIIAPPPERRLRSMARYCSVRE